jgi:hypothetical protein
MPLPIAHALAGASVAAALHPFSNQRYKLKVPNPIDYAWSADSLWQVSLNVLKISLVEMMIFGPIFLIVIWGRKVRTERHRED